jgi:tripartite-type tricarboxylate transporter receptor subunit TctC
MAMDGAARVLAAVAVAVAAAAWGPTLRAQSYPAKAIRLIVPFPPGGTTDVLARMMARAIEEDVGAIAVENRPGAGGRIGADIVAKSTPDGHTLLLASPSYLSQAEAFYPALPYKQSSFAPIGILSRMSQSLVVNPALPVHSLNELVDYAKANPGKLNWGSIGVGSASHLLLEQLKLKTGVEIVHVPYKGQAETVAAMISGDAQVGTQIMAGPAPAAVRAGKLRLLATLAPERSKLFPDAPSVDEAPGFKGFYGVTWFGLAGPAGTPENVLRRISRAIQKAQKNDKNVEILTSFSMTLGDGTPEELSAQMRQDLSEYLTLNKSLKLKLE